MSEDSMITWGDDDSSKAKAFEKYNTKNFEGVNKSIANHRDFTDLQPNISARPSFGFSDYYAFRPNEAPPQRAKAAIKMCMDAYEKVGIIHNVIDLMGDFGSQGINIVHENRSVEKFFQQWFKKVGGKERSERFLNNLYRTGNVFVHKSMALVNDPIVKYLKSLANDIIIEIPEIEEQVIPWRYTFFNPLTMDVKDSEISMFLGHMNYEISANSFIDNFKDGTIPAKILETLPKSVKDQINSGARKIDLDPSKLYVAYYKKDDWQQWAMPFTYSIIDDIVLMEKMRLADMSALDGATSNIRLWTLGNLDHKILPNKSAVDKLRNILATNSGGGTMELVWGPELTYTESNSQVYKFLGSEKYQSVLNSIYAGLGVPPTLTGMAGNGGGFTNNFISLKTMVERLQYGRDQLTRFWETEVEHIRKSMGFRKPPHVVYDQMSLSDEAAEKNLLIQLADRDIISQETLLERFKEIAPVEKMRLQRESKQREKDKLPEKAGPFHNPKDIEKMEVQHKQNKEMKEMDVENKKQEIQEKPNPDETKPNPNGRPPHKKDENVRKKRVDTPKTSPGVAEVITWSQEAFEKTSSLLNKAYLAISKKSSMRQLTKSDISDLENLKISTLSNIEPLSEITNESISLAASKQSDQKFSKSLKNKGILVENYTAEEYKKEILSNYTEFTYNSLSH